MKCKHRRTEWDFKTPFFAIWIPPYRKYTICIIFIAVLSAVLTVVSPQAQRILIDGINQLDRARTIRGVTATVILYALILLLDRANYLLRFQISLLARIRLKSAFFIRLLGLPEHFLKDRGSSYFFNRLQMDTMEIVRYYSSSAMQQFTVLLKFLFAFAFVTYTHGAVTLVCLPFIAVQYLLYRKYREKQYFLSKKAQECTASERYRMQEYLSGHATLKSHNAVSQAQEKLETGFARWRTLSIMQVLHENQFLFFLRLPYLTCYAGIALYGLNLVLTRVWTPGELWALLVLFRQIFQLVQNMAAMQFQVQNVRAAWDHMRLIVQTPAEEDEPADTAAECSLKGDIVFSHVGFSYTADHPLFQDLNFTVRKNELLFLTGANGTGKTTIFQLLLRLYEPLSGEITIGRTPVRDFSLAAYRSRIAYLGQTLEFFPDTIRKNILLNTEHSDEEIMAVFRLLKSEDLILKRPGGLDGRMTERGDNFSGGERLRIALVRELLRNTDILLLDEPASSLDPETRKTFYDLLLELRGRCTIIAIVHDVLPPSDCYSFLNLSERKTMQGGNRS